MGLALVTGASRGIGRAIALQLAAKGHTVAALARSESDLNELAAESTRIIPVAVDLTDPSALEAAVSPILTAHGPCEILVNNAGYGLRGAIEDVPIDRWRHQFELNVFAVARLCQLVLPGMRAAGAGTIVNISSVAGRIATPFSGAYAATKFALEGMSDALRVEVKQFGVRVILVQPGPVATDFVDAAATQSDGILDNPTSAYASNYRVFTAQLSKLHAGAWTADEVATKTLTAIESRNPPQRVACYGPFLRLAQVFHRQAPGLFDHVVARRFES